MCTVLEAGYQLEGAWLWSGIAAKGKRQLRPVPYHPNLPETLLEFHGRAIRDPGAKTVVSYENSRQLEAC